MWTLDAIDMSPGVLSEQSSIGETLVTKVTCQLWISGRVYLSVQVVLQLGIVGESHATCGTCYQFLLEMSS